MGGNALLARAYGCPVAVPEGEAAFIREWDKRALWLDFVDQRGERFAVGAELVAGRRYCWGGLEWEAIAAPGHDMGALISYCEATRLLISGDALWENGFGVVLPVQRDALKAARATLDRIAALDVRVVIPGHGEPFTGIAAALDRCYQRVDAFQAQHANMARYASRSM
jgi:glyoxylase-like metal-dependent hydrolase (beta-lactamase superfamily II)